MVRWTVLFVLILPGLAARSRLSPLRLFVRVGAQTPRRASGGAACHPHACLCGLARERPKGKRRSQPSPCLPHNPCHTYRASSPHLAERRLIASRTASLPIWPSLRLFGQRRPARRLDSQSPQRSTIGPRSREEPPDQLLILPAAPSLILWGIGIIRVSRDDSYFRDVHVRPKHSVAPSRMPRSFSSPQTQARRASTRDPGPADAVRAA